MTENRPTKPIAGTSPSTSSRAAMPEDFSHSWFMCHETGEVAVNKGSNTRAICPTHRVGDCLRVYVPLNEVALAESQDRSGAIRWPFKFDERLEGGF